jgi:hypothetical protein
MMKKPQEKLKAAKTDSFSVELPLSETIFL